MFNPSVFVGLCSSILNVLTGRLARIVDRFRVLNDRNDFSCQEILNLPIRVQLIHWAITFCTICGLLVCAAIVVLFVGSELEVNLSSITALLFIAAMLTLTAGLLCFLREITFATKSVTTNKIVS